MGTFLNLDEFAEEHLIEGCRIKCSVDSNVLAERAGGTLFAIDENQTTIFVAVKDLEEHGIRKRGFGSHLDMDGKIYTVMTWDDKLGIATITMEIPEQS